MVLDHVLRRSALRPPLLAAVALSAAGAATLGAVWFGGGVPEALPGLPDAGPVTSWGLPLARTTANLAAVLTVGCLLLVTALLPTGPYRLTQERQRALTCAWGAAGLWLAATVATLLLTASDLLAQPVGQVLEPRLLTNLAVSLPQGRSLALTACATLALVTFGPGVTTVRGARVALLIALAALVPPAFTGHSASAGNHDAAVISLAVHIVAATVWIAGLVAVAATAVRARGHAVGVAGKFSALAGWCLLAVAASGIVNALIRVDSPTRLISTSYGQLLIAKTIALVVLAACGAWHRRRTLRALEAGRRAVFVRLAVVELLLMAITVGLAVGLSRSPAPATEPLPYSAARELIGYQMPAPVNALRLLTEWRFDPVFALIVTVAALAYWRGVRRLTARGDAWPPGRTVAWMLGLFALTLCTMSGLATYGRVMFSVHMGQHMAMAMVVPILLVLGAPITLTLRALRPAPRGGRAGVRELLLRILHSRINSAITHPVAAMALFIGSSFVVYFTPLFEIAMRNHLGHLAMQLHFLAMGLLFFWVIIGIDPAPRRIPHFAKLIILVITMPFHSFFSIALMSSTDLIGGDYFQAVERVWGATLADDQYRAGAIAWATGDIPMLITTITLAAQWVRSDAREAKRIDRAIDRGDGKDPLTAYNAYLAALHGRDRATGQLQPDRRHSNSASPEE
ncbi:cytochrome c oxidase assembly protein [Streptomyces sp. GMY02]|uniref:bifunctional copper resistance protein CopD/cytochrome c oxidase assembly protein n=1 Tax=Streptomyces sp. GMY02 TaxID=1333528 RepID=UPI001C2BD834|nr:bifunctional copper resistance protein CopD/cytochrome c oxidase assembly protein [Streptomyces sp. GMY02]QXE38469.1 cytochrome c oxidase assembly protein [Streptomyces sp. GMY02]